MAEIRPFTVEVDDTMTDDLRRRINETRWPTKALRRRPLAGCAAGAAGGARPLLGDRV